MQHHSLVCRLHESSQTKNRCDYYHWMKDSTIIICVPAYDYADAKKTDFLHDDRSSVPCQIFGQPMLTLEP